MHPKNENSYYEETLQQHGFSARGVGWKNEAAQNIRFQQLVKIISEDCFSLNDLGCGSGDFFYYLKQSSLFSEFEYSGYDILDEMYAYAKEKYKSFPEAAFYRLKKEDQLLPADYTVASGIFNLRFTKTDAEWLEYILKTLTSVNSISRKGFAINFLTKYSDKEFIQQHLYYTDPLFIFDYCKTNFSKNVALLHDYDEYDFTILVKK